LKENVIIGKLIPAGTGFKNYKSLTPQYVGYAAKATEETAAADAETETENA
jgi:hypothetical protein